MKQVLIYLVDFLKEHHEMSMSEMSKGLGKGRNFIREAITRGYENEDKYKRLIMELRYNFFVNGDYADFLKFMEKKYQESIDSYKVALKQSLESNLDEIEKKNKAITKQGETIRSLEHRITMLNKNIDQGWKRTKSQNEEIVKLNNSITTKDKFIGGQDEEIKGLNERLSVLIGKAELEKELISNLKLELEGARGLIKTGNNKIGRQENTIESLKVVSRELGTENTKLQKRNRILLSMLLLFCAIDLITAFLRYM